MGSSQTGDRTCVPCIGRQFLSHQGSPCIYVLNTIKLKSLSLLLNRIMETWIVYVAIRFPTSILNNCVSFSLRYAFSLSAHLFFSLFPRMHLIIRKDRNCHNWKKLRIILKFRLSWWQVLKTTLVHNLRNRVTIMTGEILNLVQILSLCLRAYLIQVSKMPSDFPEIQPWCTEKCLLLSFCLQWSICGKPHPTWRKAPQCPRSGGKRLRQNPLG